MRKISFALGLVGSAFTVMMLALLRVFLDPRIYGPGLEGRVRTNAVNKPEPEDYGQDDYDDVPEPDPGIPDAVPEPAYAPAAYEPEVYEPAHAANPYGEQMYADGSYASANPYANAPAQAYPVPKSGELVEYTGPDGNIPVLGNTGRKPL